MTLWRSVGVGMAVAAVWVASGAAATPYPRYYLDQFTIGNTLEVKGFAYDRRHVNVYSAICLGLRRYGVSASELGRATYWRFKCDVVGVSEHYYTLHISTTLGPDPEYWYWHILSARREY
jgi:hypothetical protein